MDKIVIVIEQVFKSKDIIAGVVFILIAIVVGVFKQTWLIAGINTMPKKELAKLDLEYLRKWFGIFFGIFGGAMILCVFICMYLNVMNYYRSFMGFAVMAFCAFIILYFNVIKRKRIYNKNDTGQTQSVNVLAKKWLIIIAVVIIAPVGFIYFGYKEPKVIIDTNTFKLKGMYGMNITFTEISKIDTIVWREMPAMRRTNGFSFSKVNRGYFTADGKKVHLSIHSGVSPVIRIVEKNGSVYYINRKNATDTRQIFKKIKINQTAYPHVSS